MRSDATARAASAEIISQVKPVGETTEEKDRDEEDLLQELSPETGLSEGQQKLSSPVLG